MKKPRILQFSLWSLLIVIFLILFIKEAEAKTITVDDDGGQDYAKIQDAIDNANNNDTIRVYEGNYKENVVIDKSIKMIGNGSANTTIDGESGGTVININADNVEISKFFITGNAPYGTIGAGIKVYTSNNLISNCNISNNNRGISFEDLSKNNTIKYCNILTNRDYGLHLRYSSNITITNCNILKNRRWGIVFYHSNNNTISNCNISDNHDKGISLSDSSNCTISNNIFINNGIEISSITLINFVHSLENNTVNGKPLLFYINEDDKIINGIEVGQIILINCKNFEIKNLKIANTDIGIILKFCENNKISDCNISNNGVFGIYLDNSYNNTISNCIILNNGIYGISFYKVGSNKISSCNISNNKGASGIHLERSNNNTISDCIISNNFRGFKLYDSSHVIISGCNIFNNDDYAVRLRFSNHVIISGCNISYSKNSHGIYILDSSHNNILNCTISHNDDEGISLKNSTHNTISRCDISYNNRYGIRMFENSENNIIFHNNFLNNKQNAYDECSNQWDNGTEGNYWDDYDGKDINGDGIGDTPYDISEGDNQDRYPLVEPFEEARPINDIINKDENELPSIVYLLLIIVIIFALLVIFIDYWYQTKK